MSLFDYLQSGRKDKTLTDFKMGTLNLNFRITNENHMTECNLMSGWRRWMHFYFGNTVNWTNHQLCYNWTGQKFSSSLLYCIFILEILWTGQTIFERAWARAKVGGAYHVIIEFVQPTVLPLLYCVFIFVRSMDFPGRTIFIFYPTRNKVDKKGFWKKLLDQKWCIAQMFQRFGFEWWSWSYENESMSNQL